MSNLVTIVGDSVRATDANYADTIELDRFVVSTSVA